MVTNIHIENFRSIKELDMPLKKLNILYGPNGSGKSSCIYAPYVMRNFFVNPNQSLNSLFNLGFINLGGFENIVSSSLILKTSKVSVKFDLGKSSSYPNLLNSYLNSKDVINKDTSFQTTLSLNNLVKEKNFIEFKFSDSSAGIHIDFPSTLSEKIQLEIAGEDYIWNGLTFDRIKSNGKAEHMPAILNAAFETISNLEIISVKRGFFSPIFSTEQATEESLFAMQIRNEGNSFESKIDYYFKQLFNKTFRFVAIPGSTSFYLKTQSSKGFSTDLVNEGFGVNQTLYMLIKLLKKNTSLAFIEEPEIHLHPSAQSKLVDVFTEIIQKENKQIFLTTHSENIVSSVLRKIAEGELDKDDVQFYLARFEDDETKIIPQAVNDKGQIEGGLMSFMETEMAYLKTLLGV